jgi:hypothetical protein
MAADKKKQIILQTIIYILMVINLSAGKKDYWLLKNKYEIKENSFWFEVQNVTIVQSIYHLQK